MANMVRPLEDFPDHAALMGRMLLEYGELEFWFSGLLAETLNGNTSQALRVLFRVRSESQRITLGDALIRPEMKRLGFYTNYVDSIGAFRHCLKIRNQWAHCHFLHLGKLLRFTNLDSFASKEETSQVQFDLISLDLLKEQAAFFDYTTDFLHHLYNEMLFKRTGEGESRSPKPAKLPFPNLYSPPEKPLDDVPDSAS